MIDIDNFNFGDKLKALIQSYGIAVITAQIVKIGNTQLTLRLNGSNSDIDAILNSLRNPPSEGEIQQLVNNGIDIHFEHENGCPAYSQDIVSTEEDLFFKGRRVVLYIPQGKSRRFHNRKNSHAPESYQRYHLHFCSTLKQQKRQNKLERYRVSMSKDGIFKYQYIGEQNFSQQKLNVCKNCLLDLEGHRNTYSFDLGKFLDSRPQTVQNNSEVKLLFDGLNVDGMDNDYTSLPDNYRDEWRKISTERKKATNYTCEECNWRPHLSENKRFVHTHHLDTNKRNNLSENLKVLCIDCHYKYHPTLKNNADHKEFLKLQNYKVATVTNIVNVQRNKREISLNTNVKLNIYSEDELYKFIRRGSQVKYTTERKNGVEKHKIIEVNS